MFFSPTLANHILSERYGPTQTKQAIRKLQITLPSPQAFKAQYYMVDPRLVQFHSKEIGSTKTVEPQGGFVLSPCRCLTICWNTTVRSLTLVL